MSMYVGYGLWRRFTHPRRPAGGDGAPPSRKITGKLKYVAVILNSSP
jgi:hypothetical protein